MVVVMAIMLTMFVIMIMAMTMHVTTVMIMIMILTIPMIVIMLVISTLIVITIILMMMILVVLTPQLLQGESVIGWVRLTGDPADVFPETATYRNLQDFRELQIMRLDVAGAESFDPAIWELGN